MSSVHWLRNESCFRSVFRYAPFGIIIVGLDSGILKANDAASSIVGYAADDLAGKLVSDIACPDDMPGFMHALSGLLDGMRDECGQELRCIHIQGHTVTVMIGASLLKDDYGDPLVYILHLIDITEQKKAEMETQLCKLRYQSLFEHHPDLMFSLDMEGYLTYTNHTFDKAFGYAMKNGEEQPVHFRTLTAPDSLQYTEERFQLAAKGITQRYEASGVNADGNHIVYEVTNTPIIVDGQMIGVHGLSRDISQQKELLHQLQISQKMYKLISDNSQDIITYSSMDGTILFISPAVTKLLGYKPEQLIGKSVFAYWHPEDAAAVGFSLHDSSDTNTYTSRVLHKDGHYVWIETTANIVRDTNGEANQILGVGRDVTERKRAENELRATKERLESFIDHNVDPIMLFDADYKVVRVNESFEQTFGWDYAEIVNRHVFDLQLVPSDRKDELKKNLELLREGKQILGYETIRLCKDGTPLNVHLTAFPLRDEQGTISGCSVSLRDITERKQAEQFAINSEKLSITGQLAAGIAHEIRNPITAIKGFIQLMNSGFEEKRRYFDIILSEIARIEMISSELLLLAKPQTVSVTPKDIVLQLTHVKTLLESQAIMNNVQMILDFNPDEVFVSCDENQLKQVWINFIKNAIESMPGGGKIVIRLRELGREGVAVSIKDEGCGIPQHMLDKLGQPFYTTKEKGTGLGFMVSKRIIDNHNGTLTVQSKQNIGTTVTVSLPLGQQ